MSHYGNYKPNFILEDRNSFLGRLKHFWSEVKGFVIRGNKNAIRAISVALGAILLCLSLNSCKPKQIVIKEETVTRYIDSTIWHTDTTYFEVPREVYADYSSLLDTLVLQTNYSLSWTAIDTNNMLLVGEIRNKDIKVPVEYVWKEKVITNDTTIYKEKEIQVPVEVVKTHIPTWSWLCLAWFLVTMASIAFGIYKRFFNK